MSRSRLAFAALALLPAAAAAEVPVVMADTAPVHSLVAMVMGDRGTPAMILPPGASPHDAALRPSDAARLSEADVVIWTGAGLVPQLADPIATLAGSASVLALLESDGWTALPLRETPIFAAEAADDHDHGHDQNHDHDHGHDDHGHDHDHDHAGGIDPHAWLDPAVASAWIDHIEAALTAADPDGAATYAANADAAQAQIAALRDSIAADLAPLSGRAYLVPHDAYQYFETAFAMPAAGTIALSDAALPGPAHVADLQAKVAAGGIACILTDPQTDPALAALVAEGSTIRTAGADPDGTALEPGPDLYPAILTGLAAALKDCLS